MSGRLRLRLCRRGILLLDVVRFPDGLAGAVKYAAVGIVEEAQFVRTPDPVLLRRLLPPLPAGLERPVRLLHPAGNALAVFEVKALHVGDGLVQPADGAGVANRPLGPIPGGQVLAEDAADAHLARSEHLRALAVPAAHVGRDGGEGLDVALPDVALPLREHLLIDVAVEAEDEALPSLCSHSINHKENTSKPGPISCVVNDMYGYVACTPLY